MKSRYSEIMDRIEVTDEMRGRILSNIQAADIPPEKQRKVISYPVRAYLSAAACLVILLVGAFTLRRVWIPEPPIAQDVFTVVEVPTLQELSEAVGFEVHEITGLPFEVKETLYTAYGHDLAQIEYRGDTQSAIYRKSVGSEDNSGDYTDYPEAQEISAGGCNLTLKGENGLYVLAIWQSGDYAYSLSLSEGITGEAWTELLLQTNCING